MSETIEDILRDMKETARLYLAGGNDSTSVFEMLSSYHDRIEAAYKNMPGMWIVPAENAKLREENAKLRTENARLTEAMSRVVGCADSTCGEMGVCRTCKVAQFTGGVK